MRLASSQSSKDEVCCPPEGEFQTEQKFIRLHIATRSSSFVLVLVIEVFSHPYSYFVLRNAYDIIQVLKYSL